MKKKNNNGVLIGLLLGIIVMLLIFVALFATNTISFNSKKAPTSKQTKENSKQSIEKEENKEEQKKDNREEIIAKLKEKLTDETWVKDNLYSKENCFGQEVGISNRNLKFEILEDNKKNPIVIILDYSFEDFVVACYKVYIENDKVIAKLVDGGIGHPSHIGYYVDKAQGFVISNWGHMGDYTFTAYDVKNNEIEVYDKYECNTGQCEYEYKGDKKYNITEINKELNMNNINTYLK